MYPVGKPLFFGLALYVQGRQRDAQVEHTGCIPSHLSFFDRQLSQARETR
jgi:hypothetical protein